MFLELTPESSNAHLTSRLSTTNLDPGNKSLFRASSIISSVRHPLTTTSTFNHRNKSRSQRYFQGWHFGVIACAVAAGVIFVVNTMLTIWASATLDFSSFIGIIQEEKCDKTKHLDLWLHFVINVLSTLLLSASNYCMQCLTSSTRADINKAHNERRWLNIGVPSVKNLRRVSRRKFILWWCLALSSVPLHFMYNSAIFSTISAQAYFYFTVDVDFLTGSSFDLENASRWTASPGRQFINIDKNALIGSLNYLYHNVSSLTKLDNAACIKAYGNDYVSSYSDLLLVSSMKNAINSFLFWDSTSPPVIDSSYGKPDTYNWICSGIPDVWEDEYKYFCDLNKALAKADEWIVGKKPIDYCLSRKTEERCKLQFSLIIMVFVIACNLVKMICMIVTIWKERVATLVTLGDAISSFLDDPDPTTAGCCLADKDSFTTRENWPILTLSTDITKKYVPKTYTWFHAASLRRWAICIVLCLITLITAGILLDMKLNHSSLRSKSFSHLRKLGFGAVSSELLILSLNSFESGGLLVNVFVANLSQVILFFLYLNYNGLFTCMLLTSEWSGFAHERKYLRVTSSIEKQRSSYRLQLSYIYGIPLLIISELLHWLVSQSIFLARIEVFNADGEKVTEEFITTIEYSLIAVITVIIVESVMIIEEIASGSRVYDADMPLAGSCSAAISAACHSTQQDEDMSMLPVKWSAEKNVPRSISHYSFSSFEVDSPVADGRYGS